MFIKQINISYADGILKQIRFFDFPFIQYEVINNGKIKNIVFPWRTKPNTDNPVFYLKVNSKNWPTCLFCVSHWINIACAMGSDFYILCDDKSIEYRLLRDIKFPTSNIKFIASNRNVFKRVIKNICSKRWINCGLAHLTTYLHAKKNHISEFWNIDADDTSFFEYPDVVANALLQVRQYAREKHLDALSLDMHRSSFYGLYWSFGVTYTQMKTNIVKLLQSAKNKGWQHIYFRYVLDTEVPDANLDTFFTYLNDKQYLKLGTFNINNLYFLHWGISTPLEFFKQLQVTKRDKMYFPIASTLDADKGIIPVYKDVVNLECGIEGQKSKEFMCHILFGYYHRLKGLQQHFQNPNVQKLYKESKAF